MKRRNFLTYSAGLSLLPALFPSEAEAAKRKKSFRVANITDIHVKPGEIPERGMAKALQMLQTLNPKPDFIINTGDSIMDALETDKPKAQTQWDLFHKIMKSENSLQSYCCIGNHDVWGWFNKSEEDKLDKVYGKQWALDELQLPGRYYFIDKGKWAFIFLDSVQLNPAGGYIAYLKDICVANKNIKACVAGHIHLQDEVNYMGIRYMCNGAVSGNWWKGNFHGFAPAFFVLDFFDDGTIDRTIVNYETFKG